MKHALGMVVAAAGMVAVTSLAGCKAAAIPEVSDISIAEEQGCDLGAPTNLRNETTYQKSGKIRHTFRWHAIRDTTKYRVQYQTEYIDHWQTSETGSTSDLSFTVDWWINNRVRLRVQAQSPDCGSWSDWLVSRYP